MLNFILLVNKIAKFVLLIPFGYAKGTIIAKSSFSNIEYKGLVVPIIRIKPKTLYANDCF
jgi:hypothetical protein